MRLTSISGLLFTTIMLVACASGNTLTREAPPSARSPAPGLDPGLGPRLDSTITAALAGGAAPGAALVVGRHGQVVHMRGYGRIDGAGGAAAVTDSTRFDLASLTKVIGTTTAAMILEEEGRLDISKPVSFYLPEFNAPDKAAITVRHLLAHNGGFRSGAPLWRESQTLDAFIRAMNERPLAYTIGDSTIYSDWDLILTGAIVERVTGTTLDNFLQQRVWGPLGMRDTGFNPLATGPAAPGANCMFAFRADHPLLPLIAVTEQDTVYRKTIVRGVVHDENACALGGVAGHAGLFSSARDLDKFARMMLNGGSLNGVRILQPATIARWTARQGPRSSRALGWDTPATGSSAGRFFSPRSFGHTGFTGTSIWLDPEKGLYVVLLTNRVNPTRANTKHEALRRAVADLVQQAVRDAPVIEWLPVSPARSVRPGADRLLGEYAELLRGKRIALVSNHSGRLTSGPHLADLLAGLTDGRLVALFGMEYDIRSNDYSVPRDPEKTIDTRTGVPKYSLYGELHQPTPEMLAGVDVIVFDIQEVGARFYEHINILGFVMEAAAQQGIDVIVLDRPNPIAGHTQEGFITDDEFLFRFGSYAHVPVVHGLTMGELAHYYNGERQLRGGVKAKLQVVPMSGWKRSMFFDQTGLEWRKPSPNLLTLNSLLAYVGTCLFEALNVSEGRGTDHPFEWIGAPWLDNTRAVELLNGLKLPGVRFTTVEFTPEQKPYHGRPPELAGQQLHGVALEITDRNAFLPYRSGVALLWAVHRLHADKLVWNDDVLLRLAGTRRLKEMIVAGRTPDEIAAAWRAEVEAFSARSKTYRLYQ